MNKNHLLFNGRRQFIDLFLTVLSVLAIVLIVLRLAVSVLYFKVYIIGPSMSHTLTGAADENTDGGDYVYAYRSSAPRRGDIVVIKTPEKKIIKRVIALGGDTVELRQGELSERRKAGRKLCFARKQYAYRRNKQFPRKQSARGAYVLSR